MHTNENKNIKKMYINVKKEIEDVVQDLNIVGLSIEIIKNNESIFSEVFGYSNIDSKTNTTLNSKYRMASISKVIIAVAIMKLYEENKFNLDDDVNQYLKSFKIANPNYPENKITFRMLLTHTSSIIDGENYSSIYDQQEYSDYKPGTKFSYCNYGYNTLATLVEQISNTDFETYVQENIFKPLDMDAAYDIRNLKNPSSMAVLYRPKKDGSYEIGLDDYSNMLEGKINTNEKVDKYGNVILGNAFRYGPTGGVRTSPKELSKFMMMLMNDGIYNNIRILKSETIKLMEKIHWKQEELDGVYRQKGLGIHITDELINGYNLKGHAGEAYGLISGMYYNKEDKFGYIMMMNGYDYSFEENGFTEIENAIAKIISKNYMN